ncbi:MAG: DUF1800 family protein [Acidobacteriaceae bacterium]|nr:DUF1800 family protein [Acidobacteriaceae bacterium]
MKLIPLALVLSSMVASGAIAHSQMMTDAATQQDAPSMQNEAPPPTPAQMHAAQTFAGKSKAAFPPKPAAHAELASLSQRERAVQLLNRFAYGPRPGDVDRVLAMGTDKWLEQQLNPDSYKDAALTKRLADFPTLNMSPSSAMAVYPFVSQVNMTSDGKIPFPADPLTNAVMEVQVAKYQASRTHRAPDGTVVPKPILSDDEIAAKKKQEKEAATRLAAGLLVLPKNERMAAIVKMPVDDRIALTRNGSLSGEQRRMLFADFNPRERETFIAMSGETNSAYFLRDELSQARMLRDILSERQLEQVMTNFWFNHFNVYMPKDGDQWYTASYERDVIRKNALGKFSDLLLATAESPAMMVYLDNYQSIGPDSLANGVDPKNPNSKRGNKGLNENYGREVMELHTLSVNGGYSQADVTTLSAILTGWGVDRANQGGGFAFDPRRHEPGPKYWLGYRIDDDGMATKLKPGDPIPKQAFGPSDDVATAASMKQGITALKILAASPKTAHFVSYLMAQYFLADTPPDALVARLEKTYMDSDGDIKAMLRTLAHSPEFNARQYFHNKVKTPEEFVASAFRATATTPDNPSQLVNSIKELGEPLYAKLEPTGYYLTADVWMNSNALKDRLNFSYNLTTGRYGGQKFDAPKLLAIGLMTPSGAGQIAAPQPMPASSPVSATHAAPAKRVAWAGEEQQAAPMQKPAPATLSTGSQVTMRVLEATMMGTPVSSQTNQLIQAEMVRQGEGDPVQALNVLSALVMGSPEFQLR